MLLGWRFWFSPVLRQVHPFCFPPNRQRTAQQQQKRMSACFYSGVECFVKIWSATGPYIHSHNNAVSVTDEPAVVWDDGILHVIVAPRTLRQQRVLEFNYCFIIETTN